MTRERLRHLLWMAVLLLPAPTSIFLAATSPATLDRHDIATRLGGEWARGFLAGCGEPCRITFNGGGRVVDFEALAIAATEEGRDVVIDGPCGSACALFADLARPRVCIMPAASFHFHRVSDGSVPPDRPDIVAWVQRHGDFPTQASGRYTTMDFEAARDFFRPCCHAVESPARFLSYACDFGAQP